MVGALAAAIELVDSRTAASRAAVTSLGQGLTGAAQALRGDGSELGSRVRAAAGWGRRV